MWLLTKCAMTSGAKSDVNRNMSMNDLCSRPHSMTLIWFECKHVRVYHDQDDCPNLLQCFDTAERQLRYFGTNNEIFSWDERNGGRFFWIHTGHSSTGHCRWSREHKVGLNTEMDRSTYVLLGVLELLLVLPMGKHPELNFREPIMMIQQV